MTSPCRPTGLRAGSGQWRGRSRRELGACHVSPRFYPPPPPLPARSPNAETVQLSDIGPPLGTALPDLGVRAGMSNRSISWAAALRELKSDRVARSAIREERLRTSTGLRGAPVLAMSAWRGHSGRRYVVVVQPLDTVDLVAEVPAVVFAVGRDEQGQASIAAVRVCPAGDPGFLGWLAACATRGASELHTYRLAESGPERAAIAADLGGPIPTADVGGV